MLADQVLAGFAEPLFYLFALGYGLGSFLGQLTEAPIRGIRLVYEGEAAELNTRALTAAAASTANSFAQSSVITVPPPPSPE